MSVLRHAEVHGLRMAYRETGSGPPIMFLHGNPTSSYLWRNILGSLAHHGRCIALDLVGMGASDPLPDSGPGRYRFVDHREYLDELFMTIGVDREVVIVGHDWGAVLGIDWARRHQHDVRGIAYMETLVAPVSWDGENAPDPELFGPLRTEEGERLVLRDNVFVEKVLPAGTRRTLTDDELAAYRAPTCSRRVAASHADLAARDPDRRPPRRRRRRRHRERRVDGHLAGSEAVHQRRSRRAAHRAPPRAVPTVATPARETVRQIAIEERLVAVVDEPTVHLRGKRRITRSHG